MALKAALALPLLIICSLDLGERWLSYFLRPIPSEKEHQQTFLTVYWIGTMSFQIRFFIKIGLVESNFSLSNTLFMQLRM